MLSLEASTSRCYCLACIVRILSYFECKIFYYVNQSCTRITMCMSNIQYGVTACLISDLFFFKFLLLCQILASSEQGFPANIEACND